jgi:phosphoribosylpyrophosphate synthetase
VQYCTELTVASLLIYPPRGRSGSDKARGFIRYDIKQSRDQAIERTIKRLCDILPGSVLDQFFAIPRVLVPIPGHAPLRDGALWVPHDICHAMVAAGLAQTVVPCLKRHRLVARQSTRSSSEERLTPSQHVESMALEGTLTLGGKIMIVDDVVTRGSTLIAAASLLLAQNPRLDITAFALARVEQEHLGAVGDMLAPAVEFVSCDAEGTSPYRRKAAE